jgi:uncharacterized protein (DUF433 family)
MQGNRVRKVTESYVAARVQDERYRDTLYLGESEITRDYNGDTILKEWKTDHISDNQGRFALLERYQNTNYLRFTHTDLLQSTRLETALTGTPTPFQLSLVYIYNMILSLISTNPDVMLGKPVFTGTRIPIELVLAKLAQGSTQSSIIEAYPTLGEEHILAALRYAHEIVRDEEIWPLVG